MIYKYIGLTLLQKKVPGYIFITNFTFLKKHLIETPIPQAGLTPYTPTNYKKLRKGSILLLPP